MALLNYRTIATVFLTAVITALVLGAAVLFVRQDDNAPIQVLLPTPTTTEEQAHTSAPSGADLAPADLRVHLSGQVRNPGVYTLGPDDRLADAIAAAGGATADAELAAVNLARRVRDGEQYHIPRLGETPPAGSAPIADQAPTADANGRLIDLNAASTELLETLPGIGSALAKAIVGYREQNGPFQSVEEITNVPKIGPVIYENIRDLVEAGEGE